MEHRFTGRGSELGLQAQPVCTSFTHCTAAGKTQQQLAPELSRPLQALDNLPTELNWQLSIHSSGFPSGHMSVTWGLSQDQMPIASPRSALFVVSVLSQQSQGGDPGSWRLYVKLTGTVAR